MPDLSFSRSEKLKSKKVISRIFDQGASSFKYPLRLKYMILGTSHVEESGIKVAFSVPKRRIAKAVHRNLIKRRMKEAYRLNRKEVALEGELKHKMLLVFIYQANEILEYNNIEKSVVKLMKGVIK